MLRTQLRPCLPPSVPRGPGSQAFDNDCQLCEASRLCSRATAAAVWENTGARNKQVFAVWYQFGGFGLQRQGEGVRSACRRLSSRQKSCILMENREGATANPLGTEDPSMTYLRDNQNEAHLGVPHGNQYISTIALPSIVPRTLRSAHFSVVDQAFLLLGFIACTASFALFALIITAIPTLHAMRRAAVSVEKLADIAREELPGTMAAIRLSGMEISDLTLELNDLRAGEINMDSSLGIKTKVPSGADKLWRVSSVVNFLENLADSLRCLDRSQSESTAVVEVQEISDGVRNSARAVQAAEVGIRRIGAVAASQTFAILQETASVPVQVVRPAVVSAAATTLHAVSQAQKLVFSLASSSYPHISGWLTQKGRPRKQQKSSAEVAAATATLTELLTGEEILSGSPQLSLFDDTDGDKGTVMRVQAANDN